MTCKQCNQRVYLQVTRKTELSSSFSLRCPFCYTDRVYYLSEVTEERWDSICPFCNGRFYTLNPPPIRVRCPYCSSLLYVENIGYVRILQEGQIPVLAPEARSAVGAIGGILVGSVIAGPIGALFGLLAGGALGASAEYLEAKEE